MADFQVALKQGPEMLMPEVKIVQYVIAINKSIFLFIFLPDTSVCLLHMPC